VLAELVIAVALLASGVGLLALRKNLRALRELREESGSDVDLLDPARKKTIRRALWRGHPMQDAGDASIALAVVDRQERVYRLVRPMNLIYMPVLVALLVVGLVDREWRFLAWIGGISLAVGAVTAPLPWFQRRRASMSAAATRARFPEA
jgi:hypothetical protein